ncbi:RNA polymerase I enhancer binding protein [Sporothrix stenoceras]|uniref:RNA polymerase I enhancer binding protein n=1 Tax=Sporothrix stenoceras TaxID=5173 RepID=A0ABR3Z9R0_9PEZI
MAKPTQRVATPPSESGSDSEITESNIKAEPDEEEASRSQSFGISSSRALSSNDNDESEEDDDEEDSDDDKVKGEEDDEDEDSDDDDEDEDAPALARKPFKSAPARTPFKSAPPKPAAPATKASTSSSSSSSSDDDDDEDGDDSSSGSDSNDEDDKSASEKPTSSKAKGKASVKNAEDSSSDSDSDDSDSSSDSDSDSDSDSNEAEDEDTKAKNVKAEEAEEPSASEEADDTVVTAPEAADNDEVNSSDDDLEDIPNKLPPGTLPDVKGDEDVDMADAPDAPEESEKAESEEPSAEQTPDEDEPQLPQQPIAKAPAADSPAPEEPEPETKSTRASRQRSKRQVAKKPFISSQEQAAAAEEAPTATGNEAVANGELTAAAEDVPGSQEEAATLDEPPATKSSRKRKRVAVDVSEQAEAAEDPETPAPRSTKKRAAVRTPASRLSIAASAGGGSSNKKGPQGNFEPREVAMLEAAAARYMEENLMSQADFNEMVHDNAQKHSAFWDFMSSDFQNKKRLQVILRCRRIWHNFKQRYHWTEGEDAELAELVGKHGNKWLVIGAAMDRSSEDVRKRWDERVACGDKAIMSYWRFEEENRLGQIVGQILREVQGSRNQDTSTLQPSAVRDIPWHVVSERMDHTRTARQCRIKWRLIHDAYHFNDDGEFVGPPRPDELSNSQIKAERAFAGLTSSTPASAKKSKAKKAHGDDEDGTSSGSRISLPLLGITPEEDGRTVPETKRPINDKTRQQVKSMTTEDKHYLILEVRKSNVGREDKIPWNRVGSVIFRKKYSRAARELVWSRLKRSVPNYNRKSIRQICDYLIKEFDANAAVGQAWDMDFDDPENDITLEGPAPAEEAAEEAAEETGSSAMPSSGAIVHAMAAAKGRSKKPTTTYGKRGARAGVNGNAPKSAEFVAESDSDEAEANGGQATEETTETSKQPRTRKGRATRVNGNTEKHVSESENEVALAEQANGTGKRRAARLADAAATRAKTVKALTDIYSDIEGASEASNSQPNTQSQEDIEDADKDDTRRRARAASVDLSMGEQLSGAEDGDGQGEGQEEEGDGELPLTLSLSPGMARHKPTTRSRPLNVSKQRRGDGPETNGTEQASRFLPTEGGSASTPSNKLTPLRPGEVRRTKKRSLNSAQWRAEPGSDEEGGDATNITDDIEEVSEHDRPRPGASASESLTARAARAAMAFFPQSTKRMRKE